MKIMVKALKNKPRPGVLLPGVRGGYAYPILADITDKIFGVYIIKDSLMQGKAFLTIPEANILRSLPVRSQGTFCNLPVRTKRSCLPVFCLCGYFGLESPAAPKSQPLDCLFHCLLY